MAATQPSSLDPRLNPSYPQRVHLRERAQWESLFNAWDARVRQAAAQLDTKPDRPRAERLLVQMLGARDQIAESARRMPLEVGDLYEEDKHRLEEAVAALERLFHDWSQ